MNENLYIQEDVDSSSKSRELSVADLAQTSENLMKITEKLCSSVTTWKEIDMQMRNMDLQFNAYIAGLEAELTRYQMRLPMIEKQLDNLNGQMTKVLDCVIAMGTETDNEIQMKLRLLQTVENYMDNMSAFAMKLL